MSNPSVRTRPAAISVCVALICSTVWFGSVSAAVPMTAGCPAEGSLESNAAPTLRDAIASLRLGAGHGVESASYRTVRTDARPMINLEKTQGSGWWKNASTTTKVWSIVGTVVGAGIIAASLE